VTGPEPWHFAVQFPLTNDIRQIGIDAAVAGTEDLSVLVDLQVQDGRVGVGLLDENLRDYLGSELIVDTEDGAQRLTIPIPRRRKTVPLMFRDGGDGTCPFFLPHFRHTGAGDDEAPRLLGSRLQPFSDRFGSAALAKNSEGAVASGGIQTTADPGICSSSQ